MRPSQKDKTGHRHPAIQNQGVADHRPSGQHHTQEKNWPRAELFKAKRMETIGLMAGGVAHDLNNPCCPVSSTIRNSSCSISPKTVLCER